MAEKTEQPASTSSASVPDRVAVDLHLHSTLSDGSDEPEQIVATAQRQGLTSIALTDHDNLEGIDRARNAAAASGIDFIAGTELSVDWPGGTMHLLAYFLEPGEGPLQDEMVHIREGRMVRNREMVSRLNDIGIDISYEDVEAQSGGGVIGRPHFAAVLIQRGDVESIREAFDRYLATGRPGYVPRYRIEAARAIELATASGAITSIAHPHTLGVGADDYSRAFSQLASVGLGGIEAYYAEYTPQVRKHLAGLARDLGIIATGGSDYHGSYKPDLDIGVGHGDLVVPDTAVIELHEARQRLAN